VIRGVIFDLDGVLVSTDELHYRAWDRLAESEGISFERAQNERQRGVSRMESLEVVLERSARVHAEAEKQAMAARKNAWYVDALQTLTPDDALPGVRALLADLRERGIRLAIGSSSRNARLILDRVLLTEAVDAIVDGNDITASKPDPEVFLLAAGQLGLDPHECLVVEDAPAGIEAAQRAGMSILCVDARGALTVPCRKVGSLADITVDELLRSRPPLAPWGTGSN